MASVHTGLDAARLAADLGELGLAGASGVLVQASLKEIGRLANGPATLFTALVAATGADTTIVVLTHTSNNSLSSRDFHEATRQLDPAAVESYIDRMPGFDAASTESYEMGALAEYVRELPGAVRSAHPQTSFAAVGPRAAEWMSVHDLDCHLGERSPLGALDVAGARVLLIGVGLDSCTAFHLGEYRRGRPAPRREYRCFVQDAAGRKSLTFTDIHLDDTDFGALGDDFARSAGVIVGRAGAATAMTFPVRAAADFAADWMDRNRPAAAG
ncbi:aminoglycoside N(3)-acetyltransferase [Amorphoplanes digitatis]|uniref:Aminoglycoside N(3)-acetyltransferase n=1 Tax=Actinoplanes digitatis TaxID=1868 RepID=A0A7W7HVK3_9ACTN|nr:AAC(3) family N-acetyltransferase [Actinoplanes digitatis]MBB4761580.1 aminoglycoside 3-N-acetyltransferase [Actinoplanes digitatis]GID90689.1 AAC(3) family N-acetyltransferase [Actinoplanes digitatis]